MKQWWSSFAGSCPRSSAEAKGNQKCFLSDVSSPLDAPGQGRFERFPLQNPVKPFLHPSINGERSVPLPGWSIWVVLVVVVVMVDS